MDIIIVGGGKVVYHLTKIFNAKGYRIAIINKDEEYCKYLARELKALVIHGDGSDPDSMKEAQASKAEAILALTGSDPDNLFICQLARKKFGIPGTFSMINNPDNEKIFKSLGIKTIFNTTKLLSILIEQKVETADVNNLISIEEGRVSISQIILKKDSPVLNKTLKQLDLPHDIVLGSIIRDKDVLIPRGETRLLEGDKVLVITLTENQGKAFAALTGQK
ncbi:MAG TPA: NAD-binding protein [bacterium]|nr:NAD-binding protein [bacterium]